ncbi:DCD domain-containing protein NRP-B [Linum grandiflorum]
MAPPVRCYDAAFYKDARFNILSKSELGGVIFCCNDDQITECLEKKLLGLQLLWPVDLEKIDHGMPLFLFNNSDKKFHGIFERADEGKEKHLIQIRPKSEQQYQPLPLARLQRKIDPNLDFFDGAFVYYELDHIETKDLLALFQGIPRDLDLQSLSISAQTTVNDNDTCEARFQQAGSYHLSLKEAEAEAKDNVEDDDMDKVEDERMEIDMSIFKPEDMRFHEDFDYDYFDEDAWMMRDGYTEFEGVVYQVIR